MKASTSPFGSLHRFAALATRGFGVAGTVTAATLLLTLSACSTTTETNRSPITGLHATPLNSTPSRASELHLADVALNAGDVSMATTIYQRIVQADPNSLEGTIGLGSSLYAVGDFTRAGVLYDRARQIDPNAIAPLAGIGRVAIRQRRFDDAINAYRQILTKVPNNAMASAGMGVAMDMKGDHTGAQAVFRQALTANPGDPTLNIDLGLSLVLGGNAREGVRVLLDVSRFPDAPPQARQDLALAYGMLGDNSAASQILSSDLSKADIDNNLRFYTYQRARMSYHPLVPGAADGAISLPLTQSELTQ